MGGSARQHPAVRERGILRRYCGFKLFAKGRQTLEIVLYIELLNPKGKVVNR